MNSVNKGINTTFDFLNEGVKIDQLLNHQIIYPILALFLAMYGPRLQPKLPKELRNLFNNNFFRFIVIMLIAYLSSENLQLSLIIALAFCLIMSYSNTQEVLEKFENTINRSDNENFSNYTVLMNEHYLPNNEPENLGSQYLKSNNENLVEEEHIEDYQAPQECQNDTYNQACINYCYSEAGFANEFCKNKFPIPETSIEEFTTHTEHNNVEIQSPETPNEGMVTDEKDDDNYLNKVTKSILRNINQYKDPLSQQ